MALLEEVQRMKILSVGKEINYEGLDIVSITAASLHN